MVFQYLQYLHCFNTSHVTLYQEFDEDDIICALFQYISCYSLSPAWLYFVKFEGSFNTSHVTLYLAAPLATIKYCLVSIHLMLLFILYGYGRMEATTEFQYISCYSLSRKGMGYGTSGMRVSIHLMLLFILLGACNMFLSFCFNTSHVTLYRKSCCLSDARG